MALLRWGAVLAEEVAGTLLDLSSRRAAQAVNAFHQRLVTGNCCAIAELGHGAQAGRLDVFILRFVPTRRWLTRPGW